MIIFLFLETRFEDISNELIYEIFEFLDFHHAFESFYDLNIRFQNLFVYSNFPIKINISSTSKSTLQRYLKHIVIPYTYRITSLRLVNPFVADMILLLSPIMLNLTQLQALSLNNIESDYVEAVVDRLTFLPFLSSLVIISTDSIRNQNDIYQKIFRLPVLKYCKILIQSSRYPTAIPIATNEFSPIEYLIINNKVAIDKLSNLFSAGFRNQYRCNIILLSPPHSKKSIFVKKVEMEINAWEDSPEFALSETL